MSGAGPGVPVEWRVAAAVAALVIIGIGLWVSPGSGEDTATRPRAQAADVEAPTTRAPRAPALRPTPDAAPTAADPTTAGAEPDEPSPQVIADRLLADSRIDLACEVQDAHGPVTRASAMLTVGQGADLRRHMVVVADGWAFGPDLAGGPSRGLLAVEGHTPTPISWTAPDADGPGHCVGEPIVLTASGAAVTGTVRHASSGAPAAGAWVDGCGGLARADDDGSYYLEAVGGPCALTASARLDGISVESEAVPVVPVEGEDVVLDLVLPAPGGE